MIALPEIQKKTVKTRNNDKLDGVDLLRVKAGDVSNDLLDRIVHNLDANVYGPMEEVQVLKLVSDIAGVNKKDVDATPVINLVIGMEQGKSIFAGSDIRITDAECEEV